MEKGIDAPEIIHDTFYEKTYNQNQILGRALLESILFSWMDSALQLMCGRKRWNSMV